jgi:parallel beta-helix repeat protein
MKGLAVQVAQLRNVRVFVAVGIVAVALLSVSPATPAVNIEFFPEADSYTSELHPADPHGDLPYLRADDVPRRTMYLRFNVSGVSTSSSVALKLWIEKKTRMGLQVRGVSGSWDESTLTFENAPVPGPVAAESGPLPRESWISVDVSSLVQTNGNVSLAVTTVNPNSINVPSREGDAALRPRLVVTNPDPEPEPLSPFTVTHDGTLYQASSAAGVTYSGTLKTVVESAAGDLARDGGGVVRFGAGSFDLGRDALEFQGLSDVQFEGAGMDATEIRNSSIASADTEIFDLARTSRIAIRGMTLSASGSDRTTSDAIDVDAGSDTLIELVRITASRGRGIVFDGKDAFEGVPLEAARNVVRDCVISDVPGDGIQLLAAAQSRVERCTIANAGRHGISVAKASVIAAQANKKSLDNVLAANVIRGSGHDGINITSSDGNQLLGNIIANSSSTVTGGDGIRLSAADGVSCDANVIQGNTANDTRVVKRQRYGLNISDPLCARTDVRENDFSSNLRGPIQDLGTDTIFSVSVDLEAPTVPTALAVAAGATLVDVTWTEATDNVGVAGYTVYRDGVPLGTVGVGTLTFRDSTVVASTTYSYTVDAFDAVGNHSDLSAAVSVTTPAGATVSTFDAVADTYVNADSPTTNFGGGDELRTDNTPLIRSFLRFDVSGITGTVSRAKLRIFANSSSSAGFEVHALSTTFDETAVTHETAPEVGTLFGTSPAFTAGGYIEVDITAAISGNGIVELALTALGDTATSFGSRESANKPQLVIEFKG